MTGNGRRDEPKLSICPWNLMLIGVKEEHTVNGSWMQFLLVTRVTEGGHCVWMRDKGSIQFVDGWWERDMSPCDWEQLAQCREMDDDYKWLSVFNELLSC